MDDLLNLLCNIFIFGLNIAPDIKGLFADLFRFFLNYYFSDYCFCKCDKLNFGYFSYK